MSTLINNQILEGDALTHLKNIPDASIDCVVTSPPYWQLRDYGMPEQLGREADVESFIQKLCGVFDEVYRVLKPEATCFVNLGDTFSKKINQRKSLCGIPFRFSIEMLNRQWLLRNTLIWHKPNAVPQNAKDRFTVDFEYFFFFTKSSHYYFAQQFEPMNEEEALYRYALRQTKHYCLKAPYQHQLINSKPNHKGRNKRSVWSICTKPYNGSHIAPYPEELIRIPILAGCPEQGIVLDPFLGSGTTAKVALELGRQYIGIELNPEYVALARARLAID